ncbi:DUF805 domain-containing protein [Streptomyces sp. SP18BB07]|uniref:DUF805 domain-containing protein n=1 Tax=Streptomyces sp. SP18BB07 TaxID=3002522 RepID=UPI002E79330B|nr:DUF805 domain-containing protein [Streptomyces sp. SP18BB07]MEE1758487.1 DUF805 domain-containing protein [Streptomyces sp. SP18BB07]
MNWFIEVLKKYAVFSGRARRQEYWMFTLISSLIYLALYLLGLALDTQVPQLLLSLAPATEGQRDANQYGPDPKVYPAQP